MSEVCPAKYTGTMV